MLNTYLEIFIKFQTSWQWQLHYGKYSRNHCFYIVWQAFTEHCLKIEMDLDCPYQIWGKTLYCTWQIDSYKHLKNSNKLTVTIALWKIIYKSLFLYCWTSLHWRLPKNDDAIGLAIPKLKEKTIFDISNRFLQAFVKF